MAKIPDYLRMSAQQIEDLMTQESRLRISTIGPGTQINLTPMTFGWAGGFVYIFGRGQKVVNLRRNPTATVLVDIGDSWRELQGVMMNGTAKILESSIDEIADEYLLEAQLNLGRKSGLVKDGKVLPYQATASGNTRRWIVFKPDNIISWDNSLLPRKEDDA